ncbi:hypothetical protein [Cellulophaga baltica]|uniref:Lipoprotein n=1 Tax=Cellulophaga baltica 18 TaxID=1348584 RepID=A0AAU8S0I5_9FLAO|nr:hypothetical protein [Cellulophaga baltica]AIZ42795.1 hypothetical protein M666_15165 [Cellulophaga baltica 18]
MKTITKTVILLSLLITSCNSQTKMDILNLKLPLADNLLINERYNIAEFNSVLETGYSIYRSYDPNLLIFDNEIIASNSFNNPNETTNYGLFYVKNDSKLLSLIKMTSFETEKTKLLHEILLKKFGKPNYYESISFASYSVWEDKLSGNIYLFEHNYGGEINNIPVEEGLLFIIDYNDEELLDKYTKANYSYYQKYLKRRKLDGKEYSYEEFAKKENENGTSRYLKAISDPVNH